MNDIRRQQSKFIQITGVENMKAKLFLLLAYILLATGMFGSFTAYADTGIEKSKQDRIDEYVQREMKAGKIPGLSLGIVYGNEIVYLKGYGYADKERNPITPDTPFIIGSVSKTFTALAIRQLVNEGKLDYNAPVQKYISWFTTADPKASAQITIKHLIDHTSGFSKVSGEGVYTGYKYSLEQLVRQLSRVKLNRPVGSSSEYSNYNYLVLGLVVQTVSGKTYEEYVQENIFNPLEMENTFTSEDEADKKDMAMGHHVVYGMVIPTHIPYPKGNISHGFIISSAEDMAKYLICYLNSGYYKGMSIIPNNELKAPEYSAVSFSPKDKYYLSYWDIADGDRGYYGHQGETVNYSSTITLSQKSRYGIVILTNVSNSFNAPHINPDAISSGIISILSGRDVPPSSKVGISSGGIAMLVFIFISALVLALRAYRVKFFTSCILESRKKYAARLISTLVIDIAIPLAIIFVLPKAFDCTMAYALSAIPEQVFPLLFIAVILLIIGFVKIIKLFEVFNSRKLGASQ